MVSTLAFWPDFIQFFQRFYERFDNEAETKANVLTEEKREILKRNYKKVDIISRTLQGVWFVTWFMVIYSVVIHQDILRSYRLTHLLLSKDFTEIKVFVVGIFSMSYWMIASILFANILFFGKKEGKVINSYMDRNSMGAGKYDDETRFKYSNTAKLFNGRILLGVIVGSILILLV